MIPSKLNLGCGNLIKVEQVPRATIQSLAGRDTYACWSCDAPEGSPYVGIIFIDKSLSLQARREAMYHELLHALVDVFQWTIDKRGAR